MKLEEVIALRMREAREAVGLSQEALGIQAGIDEATAKVRINQYENGKHTPPMSMLEKIAGVVAKPVTWFLCSEDTKLLHLALSELPNSKRSEVIKSLISVIETES